MADLERENDDLKRQICEVQCDLEHQKEQYGQLQVQVMAKRQLTGPHSIGDVRHNNKILMYMHVYTWQCIATGWCQHIYTAH